MTELDECQSWEEFFARVTYKPGFKFYYDHEINRDWHWVILEMRVPDSRSEPQPYRTASGVMEIRHPLIPVSQKLLLDPWFNEAYAKRWLRYSLRKMEDHELDEWFKYDGEMVNDPHANDVRI